MFFLNFILNAFLMAWVVNAASPAHAGLQTRSGSYARDDPNPICHNIPGHDWQPVTMGEAGQLLGSLSGLTPKQPNHLLPQRMCSLNGKNCVNVACIEREGKKKKKSALVSFCSSNPNMKVPCSKVRDALQRILDSCGGGEDPARQVLGQWFEPNRLNPQWNVIISEGKEC
ncbi:hypothetical protein HYFRA_00004380 [Hymenoscyphus fraxineus]|uniref:Secreted protein n=1 Tax=Hymenoscyphus fraxineus TaxID=746836 RepID=A0A9N9KX71_9HELO|nr:hypothetical protein HYFRA_00004380 [Hymenoscyphus fraxineus]